MHGMDRSLLKHAWVLTGPTASGKSARALEFAEHHNCEIIALDSMTLYRGMDIGTAKPSRAERARVPHHLIDVLDPWESSSVAWWLDQAIRSVREIRARGNQPLFVGGTPLYLKALLQGLFDSVPIDPTIRPRLEHEAETHGPAVLHDRLKLVDPQTAERLHVQDVRRVIRALEVWESTGQPISTYQQNWDGPTFGRTNTPESVPMRIACMTWPREILVQRIHERVEQMVLAGWQEEARVLTTGPRPLSREAAQAVGYQEWHRVEQGELTREVAVERIKIRTRQFAKRQMTWFRSLPGLHFLEPEHHTLAKLEQVFLAEHNFGTESRIDHEIF
jgi:tRNA dimethylallyltransferase